MSSALKPDLSANANQENPAQPAPAAGPKPAVFRVSAADVVRAAEPALPRLQTFEELQIPDNFRKAIEQELTKDEKILWLGCPSRNPAVYPDNRKMLMVIGGVVIGIGLLVPLLDVHLIFFSVVAILLGGLFVAGPKLFKSKVGFESANLEASGYKACYVVTNRRAIVLERRITGQTCKSYHPHELVGLERKDIPSVPGAGNLVFEYVFAVGNAVNFYPRTSAGPVRTDTPQRIPRGFLFLDQAREVEHLIRTTLLTSLENKLDA